MQRPRCPQHPDGRVWRDGKYGKRRQYQRWKCVPGGNGKTHVFQPILPRKEHSGDCTGCLECGRTFGPGEGMATGRDDRFSLREKARALHGLSIGMSYREAAHELRYQTGEVRLGPNGMETSRDGRMTRDWVSHYARILAGRHLPRAWPEVLLLDALPFHVRARTKTGKPKKGGRRAFVVLAALSYGNGTVNALKQQRRKPVLWRIGAYPKSTSIQWSDFFRTLPRQPRYVVCDQERGLLRALRHTWPRTKVYPCTHHLQQRVKEQLRKSGLTNSPVARTVHSKTFAERSAYDAFVAAIEDGLASETTPAVQGALLDLKAWVTDWEPSVLRSIAEPHQPMSTGALERYLRGIKDVLYSRRALFKNLDRLDDLLVLCQLRMNGFADAAVWGRYLEEAVEQQSGRLPGRRVVDITGRRLS